MRQRNGLLEIYRLILSFMPLYYHSFFFFERNYDIFDVPELAVDFFFMLSGFFLMRSMRKLKDERIIVGVGKMLFGRLKPMLFTMCFISAFNLICLAIFVRGDYLNSLFQLFKYWWFVLYLMVGVVIYYLVYRALNSERLFVVFLAVVALLMATVHYLVVEQGMLIYEVVFFTRAFGSVAAGILVSYIPRLKVRKFNHSIPIVILLIPSLLYLAYNNKTFFICIAMIVMFGALMYFSTHISVGGRFFDFLGKLSVRMYLYMALLTMIAMMGLTHHRLLFAIDIAVATIDVVIHNCFEKRSARKINRELALK